MTQHPGFVVTLDRPCNEEEAEIIGALLRQIKGVVDVSPVAGDPVAEQMAAMRADSAWRSKLLALANGRQPS